MKMRDFGSRAMARGVSNLIPLIAKTPRLVQSLAGQIERVAVDSLMSAPRTPPLVRERKCEAARALFSAFRHRLSGYAPEVQRRLPLNMIYNNMHLGGPVRDAYFQKYGEDPPLLYAISPSMRCDLHCFGCYAAEYARQDELSKEEVIDVIEQGKRDLGIYFVVISGGEPTAWPHLLDVLRHHDDVIFQVYSHGMNFGDALAERFAELGNAYPAISIEGRAEHTDARRGRGAHARILASMRRLRNRGVPFGFSVTHTRLNHDAVTSDRFAAEMYEAGATFGWYFQYVPTGRSPQMDLVPTAEQRVLRFEAVDRLRARHPMAVFDFWNDGEASSGCIAWGKTYFHVNARGDVEPCVFVHFAKDNVRRKRLVEIVQSDCFRDARSRMPFNRDYRFPCSMIDNVDVLPELVRKHDMQPTHEGAERILGDLAPAVRQNAQNYWDLICQNPLLVRPARERHGATPACAQCRSQGA